MKFKSRNFIVLIVLVSCAYFAGCATVDTKPVAQESLFYPPLPEEPRIQYLTSISSSEDIQETRAAFEKFIVGDVPRKSIIKPYGVKVKDGKIYVCETEIKNVLILDLENKTFDELKVTKSGKLTGPINLDVTNEGMIYVADARRGQVVVFNKQGGYAFTIGDKGELKPTGVVVKKDKVYVCDLKSQSIKVYQRSNNSYLYSIPKDGDKEEAKLFSPTNIALDNSGNIYVSDIGSFNVKKYTQDGELVKVFGNAGDAPGQFARPKGVAVDKDDNVYIVDAAFENIQIFNSDGELLLFFPDPEDRANLVLPTGLTIDYDNVEYFSKYVDKDYNLEYLILVANQFGNRKISVFGFITKK